MNSVHALRRGDLQRGRLEESVEVWSDSLDAWPRRQHAAPHSLSKLVSRDGIKWQLKEGLSLAQREMAEIGRIKAIAKEDVQDLAGNAPVPCGRRQARWRRAVASLRALANSSGLDVPKGRRSRSRRCARAAATVPLFPRPRTVDGPTAMWAARLRTIRSNSPDVIDAA